MPLIAADDGDEPDFILAGPLFPPAERMRSTIAYELTSSITRGE